jgi:hypothetical protein
MSCAPYSIDMKIPLFLISLTLAVSLSVSLSINGTEASGCGDGKRDLDNKGKKESCDDGQYLLAITCFFPVYTYMYILKEILLVEMDVAQLAGSRTRGTALVALPVPQMCACLCIELRISASPLTRQTFPSRKVNYHMFSHVSCPQLTPSFVSQLVMLPSPLLLIVSLYFRTLHIYCVSSCMFAPPLSIIHVHIQCCLSCVTNFTPSGPRGPKIAAKGNPGHSKRYIY